VIVGAASFAVFAALTALVTYLGYLVIFTQYQIYDDEGIFLLGLRSFASGRALYDEVDLPYGPFYFEFFRLLAAFGVPLDLDSGRLMTLVLWSGVTLLIGVSTYAFTRNLFLGAAALLVAFAGSLAFGEDPMHPSCLLTLLVIGIEVIALMGAGRWNGAWPWVAMGAALAATLLIKLNVGAFAVIALAFAFLLTIPSLSRNPLARLLGATIVVALPFVLMHNILGQDWAMRYAVTIGLGAMAMVVATAASTPESGRRPVELAWLVAGGAVVTVAVVAILAVTGTTFQGLAHGLILDPLQFTQVAVAPLILPSNTLKVGLIALAGAIVWTVYRLVFRTGEPALEGMVRISAGLVIWATLVGTLQIPGLFQLQALGHVVSVPVVLAWIVVAPRTTPEGWAKLDFARVLLAAMAIVQALQAFPVPGAQIAYGSLPLVPLGGVCIHDGLRQLGLVSMTRQVAAAGLFAVIAAGWLPSSWRELRDRYAADISIGLPGASLVRLPADQANAVVEVTRFVRTNCDTYISIPGMDSFYIFAQLPPPTPPTRWIWVGTDVKRQQEVVNAVRGVSRLCVIENHRIIPRDHPRGPMDAYVSSEFVVAETVSSYIIFVRR